MAMCITNPKTTYWELIQTEKVGTDGLKSAQISVVRKGNLRLGSSSPRIVTMFILWYWYDQKLELHLLLFQSYLKLNL